MINSFLKRLFDIAVSFFLIFLLTPFLLIICLTIFFEIKQNPIFIQKRNGKNLKKFKIFKLKTMYQSEDGVNNFTQVNKGDARISRTGSFLRKNSLDELPQIFNVLIGNMSLVGPRPHPIALDEQFKDVIKNYNQRYDVLPGITGLAQIRGYRGETDTIDKMNNRVKSDIEYTQTSNFFIDLKIIFQTFRVLFKGI
tara:strand:- start:3444 stop:4031 length:588 start_codon:yes stop_codon:yes gene_type:complete